jgi:poly-gamma-glutamate capsule biosynthesis protein CapA/YwtB (metallophosphatase superfamily)
MPNQNNNSVRGLAKEARQETLDVGSTLKKAAKLALEKVGPAQAAIRQTTANEMRYAADWLSGKDTRKKKRAAKRPAKKAVAKIKRRAKKVLKAAGVRKPARRKAASRKTAARR